MTDLEARPDRTYDRHELRADRRVLAGGELPVGRPDLPAGQPAAARAAAGRARQAAAARALGHHPGAEPVVRAPEPGHQGTRPQHALHHRPRPRRPRPGRQRLPRRHLQRGLFRRSAGTRTACAALFRQFSFPGGIPSHVAPETPGLDPRGRRARLRPRARLRRRVRQPRPARPVRHRRRRGRDRTAGRELALQQVPQPGHATARCCRCCT